MHLSAGGVSRDDHDWVRNTTFLMFLMNDEKAGGHKRRERYMIL